MGAPTLRERRTAFLLVLCWLRSRGFCKSGSQAPSVSRKCNSIMWTAVLEVWEGPEPQDGAVSAGRCVRGPSWSSPSSQQ